MTDPGDGESTDSDASDSRSASPGERVRSPAGQSPPSVSRVVDRLQNYIDNPTLAAVLLVVVVALVVRLFALGGRIFHWDEARVGYWILRYGATGELYYRPIIHGPFVQIVNNALFSVLPPTDAVARLPVAVVGGVLPLFAWLVRDRLDRAEVVALALLLAFNPLLVYYSRFMRSDILVGAFAMLALGMIVRAFDARRPGYLIAAGALFGLAFTAKENALVYLLCFVGGGVLLLDHRIVRRVWTGQSLPAAVTEGFARTGDRLAGWLSAPTDGRELCRRRTASVLLSPLGAVLAGLAVIVFFYAPRPALWGVLADPGTASGVLYDATIVVGGEFIDTWGGGGHQVNDYLPYLYHLLRMLAYGAPFVVAFAVLGAAVEGYGTGRSRELVAFGVYVGIASVIGYPEGTDIGAPWIAVHVVLPLTIPAAVGVAAVGREVPRSLDREDAVAAALSAILLLSVVSGVIWLNADYFNSASPDDPIVQYAQPHNDLRETIDDAVAISEHNEGIDVLYYGTTVPGTDETRLYVEDEHSVDSPPPGGPAWHSRLPLPWYFERAGVTADSTPPDTDPAVVGEDPPPVVIAHDWDREALEPHLDGYVAREHYVRLWNLRVVVFLEADALERADRA